MSTGFKAFLFVLAAFVAIESLAILINAKRPVFETTHWRYSGTCIDQGHGAVLFVPGSYNYTQRASDNPGLPFSYACSIFYGN